MRAASANSRARRPTATPASPAITTVAGPRSRTTTAAGRSALTCSGGAAGGRSASPTNGSVKAALTCTGPGSRVRSPRAAAITRPSPARHRTGSSSVLARCRSATTWRPKMPTCSVVWFAPLPTRVAGRSAVTSTSGTPDNRASITEGMRLPSAVPDVTTTAAAPVALARPRARKPATRSSVRVCRRSRPAPAGETNPIAIEVLREPGHSTTSVMPASARLSAMTAPSRGELTEQFLRQAGPGNAPDEPATTRRVPGEHAPVPDNLVPAPDGDRVRGIRRRPPATRRRRRR